MQNALEEAVQHSDGNPEAQHRDEQHGHAEINIGFCRITERDARVLLDAGNEHTRVLPNLLAVRLQLGLARKKDARRDDMDEGG